MARRLDLSQLRKAKNNQFKPDEPVAKTEEESTTATNQKSSKRITAKPSKSKPVENKKAGRPVDEDKKPTRATSIRVHPDLVEVPKILAGISRKNVYSIYNEMIVEMLVKYKKKYPQLLDDLKIPPQREL